MADFLTNLAMRIAAPLEMVRPRLPSMFEPSPLELPGQEASEAAWPGEQHLEEVRDRDPRAIDADADPARPGEIPSEAPASPRSRASMDAPEQVMPPAEPPPNLDERVAPPRSPREARSGEASLHDAAPPDELASSPSSRRSSMPTRDRPRDARPTIMADRAPPRRAPVRTSEPEARLEPERDAARTRHRTTADAHDGVFAARHPRTPRTTPANSEHQAPPVRPALVAPRTRFDDWRDPPHGAAVSVDSEPTIHVTIGRVEVRAVTAPSRGSAKERAASAVMSLEEYLRTRAR